MICIGVEILTHCEWCQIICEYYNYKQDKVYHTRDLSISDDSFPLGST